MIVNICHYGQDEHAPIFEDVIDSIRSSFCRLGVAHRSSRNYMDFNVYNLLVGEVISLEARAFPPQMFRNSTIFQLESLTKGGFLEQYPNYLNLLRQFPVIWDYSQANIRFLREQGINTAVHVPVGYDPILERIPQLPRQDVDVLFYGSANPRRGAILDALRQAGFVVEYHFGLYSGKRDSLVSRSKIVLNIHQFDGQVVEEVRLSYLLANGRFVISEAGDHDPYDGGVVFTPYDKLVESCTRYLRPYDKAECDKIAAHGQAVIRQKPFWLGVRTALLASGFFPQLTSENPAWDGYWPTVT